MRTAGWATRRFRGRPDSARVRNRSGESSAVGCRLWLDAMACTETRTGREPSYADGEITASHDDAINKEENGEGEAGDEQDREGEAGHGEEEQDREGQGEAGEEDGRGGKEGAQGGQEGEQEDEEDGETVDSGTVRTPGA